MILKCSAARFSAYIDPYGVVHPCTMWNRPLGNVNASNLADILNSDAAKEARALIDRKACPKCWTPCEAQPSFVSRPTSFLRRGRRR